MYKMALGYGQATESRKIKDLRVFLPNILAFRTGSSGSLSRDPFYSTGFKFQFAESAGIDIGRVTLLSHDRLLGSLGSRKSRPPNTA